MLYSIDVSVIVMQKEIFVQNLLDSRSEEAIYHNEM